jgi:hypothetical protein
MNHPIGQSDLLRALIRLIPTTRRLPGSLCAQAHGILAQPTADGAEWHMRVLTGPTDPPDKDAAKTWPLTQNSSTPSSPMLDHVGTDLSDQL